MLLYLEDIKTLHNNTYCCSNRQVRTNRISRGYFDIIYEVLAGIEMKMDPFVQIKPDFAALEKRQKWENYIKGINNCHFRLNYSF
jgi:hypothetical protein